MLKYFRDRRHQKEENDSARFVDTITLTITETPVSAHDCRKFIPTLALRLTSMRDQRAPPAIHVFF